MYQDIEIFRAEERKKREQACSSHECLRRVKMEDSAGNNQQNRERLLCKINLCR
ncbi:MAG: hypothetical protein V5A83_06330 [Candidatus Bipolaricaulota bacterium]